MLIVNKDSPIETLMSKRDKELSEFSQVYFRAGWKELTSKLTAELTAVNVATVELRFGAVALAEKLVSDKTYEKISIAGSHFGTHGYAVGLFEKVVPEWKTIECEH